MRQEAVDERALPEPLGGGLSRWTVALTVVGLAVAVWLRVWILSGPLGAVDMDEAVSGLMARHFQHGHLSVFFWGQNYGGSQEAMATALVFALVGSGRVALKAVPLLGCAASAWLVWRIGRRTLGEPRARIAAVIFLIGPAFFVLRSTRAYGFYATALFTCTAAMLAALRLRERESTVDLLWLGFVAGVGWWATPQAVFVLLPTVAWLVVRAPALLRRTHVAAAGALAGTAPWLAWSATHHWASLRSGINQPGNTFTSHLHHFFDPLLPEAVGLRMPYSGDWVFGALAGVAAYVVVLAGLAVLLWRRPARLELVLVVAAAYPILFAVSPASFYTGEPRYLFLLSPVVALLLGWVLTTPARQLTGLVLVTVLSVTALHRIGAGDPYNPKPAMTAVVAVLDAEHVDRVFAPYRIAHRLSFDSRERIVATPTDVVRSKGLEQIVRTSALPGYVVLEGSPEQARLSAFLLRTGNVRADVPVGLFHVYVPVSKVLPEQWR